jgi:hypothetical protein
MGDELRRSDVRFSSMCNSSRSMIRFSRKSNICLGVRAVAVVDLVSGAPPRSFGAREWSFFYPGLAPRATKHHRFAAAYFLTPTPRAIRQRVGGPLRG